MRPTRRHENRRRAAPPVQTRTRADRCLPTMRPTRHHENRRRAAPHERTHADRRLPTMRPTRRHGNRRRAAPHAQTRPRADRRIPAMRPTRRHENRRHAAPHERTHADRRIPAMRPTRRPFETSSDLPIISRIAPPRISFVENAHALSVKYCAVPFARRHAHMPSPCAHNYSRHARARPMRSPEPLQRAARPFPIQFELQYILSFIWRATAGRIRRFSA